MKARQEVVRFQKCEKCKREMRCACCGSPAFVRSGFGRWINKHSNIRQLDKFHLDVNDLDFMFNFFRQRVLVLVEVKTFGERRVRFAQEDSQWTIEQLVQRASDAGWKIDTARGFKPYRFAGYHLLVLSGTSPDNSEWMELDGERITERELLDTIISWGSYAEYRKLHAR